MTTTYWLSFAVSKYKHQCDCFSVPPCVQADRGGVGLVLKWRRGEGAADAMGTLSKQARKRQRSRGLIRAATGEHSEET